MVGPLPEHDVFLCYNRLEREAAAWLETKLAAQDLRVFRDDRSLAAGDSLPDMIPTAIRSSSTTVVLIGASGLGSWQELEVGIAVHKRGEDPDYRVLVVMLPGANQSTVPEACLHFVRVDFSAGFEDQEALKRLVDGIHGRSTTVVDAQAGAVRPPFRSMALQPDRFVERPERSELARLLQDRREAGEGKSLTFAVATAVRGAGGFGKTALVQALCEEEDVRKLFPAGILWATLGVRPSEGDLISRVRDLMRWWTGREPPSYETVEASGAALREALSGQRVLLVLDDVWRVSDLTPFGGIEAPAALLLTTRNARTVPAGSPIVVVDALAVPNAVKLLAQGLRPLPLDRSLERLARRLGEWPILLRLVNAQLRAEYQRGVEGEHALKLVESALDEVGLTAFDREDEVARNLAVRRTVEVSLQRLSSDDRQCYVRLGVFAEDEQVPLAVLELLWGLGDLNVHRLCGRLSDLSLLYRFDPTSGWFQLHDVMRSYLVREHDLELASFHADLVDAFETFQQEACPHLVENYFLHRLPYHLKESGRQEALEELLFSFRWLERKVCAAGVNSAIGDYRLLREHKDGEAVCSALLRSRNALSTDSSQLASHLHARLGGSESPRVRQLLSDAEPFGLGTWLRPLIQSFTNEREAFLYQFTAHEGEVAALADLDGERFATASSNGEIRVWDVESGESVCASLEVDSAVRHLASPSPTQLLTGSDDGLVRLWDLEDNVVIRTFTRHTSSVSALCLRKEQFLTGSEDGEICLWSLESEEPICAYVGHESRVNDLGFLDARRAVSVGKDRTLRVWHLVSGRQLRVLGLRVFAAEALEVTASNEVIVGTFDGTIEVWKPLSPKKTVRRSVKCRSVGVDGLIVVGRDLGVSGSRAEPSIKMWNPTAGRVGPVIHVPGEGLTALAKVGRSHLVCGSRSGTVIVWLLSSLRAEALRTAPDAIYAVSPVDERIAVSGSSDEGQVQVWSAREGRLIRAIEGHKGTVGSLCVLGHERVASSSSGDGTVRIWNPHTGDHVRTIKSEYKPGAIASLGENLLVLAPVGLSDRDESIQLWEVETGGKMIDLPAMPGGVGALCTYEGRFVVVGTYEGLVLHLDLSTYQDWRNFALRGHEPGRGVVSLTLLEGGRLASGSLDTTIRIWDLERRETISVLQGHAKEVTGLASVSPQLLVSSSADHTAKLWNLETGAVVATLEFDTSLRSLAIMPDKRTLLVGDAGGTVHFLRLEGL